MPVAGSEVDLDDPSAVVIAALDGGGPIDRAHQGFRPRPAQQRLAAAVARTLDAREVLLAEAGTGTGKTYAYLVPALLSGLRTIIATGTRALQDQLFHRDLPRVRDALGIGLRCALLKGRSNYICRQRLDRAHNETGFETREAAAVLAAVRDWTRGSRDGDIAGIDFVPEASPLWPEITSTVENCLGGDCPFWEDCFVVQARREAQEADLVVVNHHLLLADLALKRDGFGEILPGAEAFIIDEAHQLPELAAQFFSSSVSSRQLRDLARDSIAECAGITAALNVLREPAQEVEQRLRELRLAWDPLPARGVLADALAHDPCRESLDALALSLVELARVLLGQAERSSGLANCAERARLLADRIAQLEKPPSGEAQVRWFELSAHGFSLHLTPLDVAGPLSEFRQRSHAAWVFTSATLAVSGSFEHFAEQLGLQQPTTLLEASPFDFARQTLAYLPPGLPEPGDRHYTTAVIEAVLPVLAASAGRAFLLFTSHRALREAAGLLEQRCEYPLFVQGTQPRHRLLDAFRASGNGVLLGAASFWEGVDVAGDALSVVMIDKLPFAAPDDPVLDARLAAIRERGGQPFRDWQVPSAAIALKQGVGRLIRSDTDRGVLVLCDPRLLGRGYGRIFLASLPPLPRTRDIADVEAFFDSASHGSPSQA